MRVRCKRCQGVVEDEDISRASWMARCPTCKAIFEVQSPALQQKAPTQRVAPPVPAGLEATDAGDELVITWRPTRTLALALVVAGVALGAGAAFTAKPARDLLFGLAIMCVIGAVMRALTSTTVRVRASGIVVNHVITPRSDLEQVYCVDRGGGYQLEALLKGGQKRALGVVATLEQAAYIERSIETRLGIVDLPVDGEAPRP
jgi:hypothetical protein